MKTRFGIFITVLALLLPLTFVLIQPSPCEACSCATPALDQAAARSEAVFIGKALEVKWVPDPYDTSGALGYKNAVRFEVERTFKGADTTQIIVGAGTGEAACGIDFTAGESYLVFAYETENHELVTRLCSRTRAVQLAADDLNALGSGHAPAVTVDLSGQMGDGRMDKLWMYTVYLLRKAVSAKGLALLSIAFLVSFIAAAVGFRLRRQPLLHKTAVTVGVGASLFTMLLWIRLALFNLYGGLEGAYAFWPSFWLMLLPAVLALISSARRSPLGLGIAWLWSLPMGLLLAAARTPFSWFAAAVLLYFIAAIWLFATKPFDRGQ
ncbi:hypothetical protein O9H85_29010 [Paenibacillus filicis]|uniref:Uncharacterized protein n=1 Tax=Paenibacillus gyeongsangnamensis TaxID=3388067 RepID=A0ABT4QHJ0_9BACL|nr:hypothetical protein [Paenibacillus filicis]MCZ8516360.1 hypothetical protein [Paenibacillus filicis]